MVCSNLDVNRNALKTHGGNISMLLRQFGLHENQEITKNIIDFSSNINPYGPPEGVKKAIKRSLEKIDAYPDPEAKNLIEALSKYHGIPQDYIVIGNGSIELIYLIARILAGKNILLPVPSFTEYELACIKSKCNTEYVKALNNSEALEKIEESLARSSKKIDAVFIGNPNNPCGYLIKKQEILNLIKKHKDVLWVIDEAFIEFTECCSSETKYFVNNQAKNNYGYECSTKYNNSLVDEVINVSNLIVIRSMTKIYSIAGIRLGYLLAAPQLCFLIKDEKFPWSINILAIEAGIAALKEEQFKNESVSILANDAAYLYKQLKEIQGLIPYKPTANFILVQIDRNSNLNMTSLELQERLIRKGIAIRDCSTYTGLDGYYFRVAVKKPEQNKKLIKEILEIMKGAI